MHAQGEKVKKVPKRRLDRSNESSLYICTGWVGTGHTHTNTHVGRNRRKNTLLLFLQSCLLISVTSQPANKTSSAGHFDSTAAVDNAPAVCPSCVVLTPLTVLVCFWASNVRSNSGRHANSRSLLYTLTRFAPNAKEAWKLLSHSH